MHWSSAGLSGLAAALLSTATLTSVCCSSTASNRTPIHLSTPGMSIVVEGGTVTGMTNSLTGERLTTDRTTGDAGAGLHMVGGRACAFSSAMTRSEGSGGRTAYIWKGKDGNTEGTAETSFTSDPRSDSVTVTATGQVVSRGGVYGISWGLGDIPDSYSLLVPGESGQRLSRDAPSGSRIFEYPMGWEAPFVLIQGPKGGVIVRAEDTEYHFKALVVEHTSGVFRLRFETRNAAPFDDKPGAASVRWRISAYRGPWQTGAAVYNNWAKVNYKLVPLEKKQPAWAKDIRFVVIAGMDAKMLEMLAKQVDPRQTLLYIPSWRRDGYDRNYPDYTAIPEFEPFVRAAHKLGYRVMAHVNYFGCDLKNPLYAKFSKYQLKDPFTKELQWWWPEMIDPTIKFAYTNPASKEWRQLFISRMVELVGRYHVDAFHLDQTLVMVNDANGIVDGMNCIQGNLALHKELHAALPQIALSGEGLDEVTCRYECFAQRHEWGVNFFDGTWNDRRISQAHPVSSSLLLPYTTMYGYLGMPNPEQAPGTFLAWRRAYERYGVIPTIQGPSQDQLTRLPASVASVLDDARFWQKNKPVADFTSSWGPNDLFVYKLADGGRAFYRQKDGILFGTRSASGKERILSRMISGVSRAAMPGSIPDWYAYDAKSLIGLNPAESYSWNPKPRDLKAMHIDSLPGDDVIVTQSGIHPNFARFKLTGATGEIHLWDFAGSASCGVSLTDGTERKSSGISFTDPTGGTCQPASDGIDVHPPWNPIGMEVNGTVQAKGVGDTFIEYRIQLPQSERVWFECGVCLRKWAEGKSDGVTIKAVAISDGKTLSSQVHNDKEAIVPLSLDLSPFAGKSITLRLVVNPGPAGLATYDWGRIAHPVVASESSRRGAIRIVSPKPIEHAVVSTGDLSIKPSSANAYTVEMSLPNTLLMPFAEPTVIGDNTDLLTTAHSAYILSGSGLESPLSGYAGAAVGEAECKGEKHRALHEHTPSSGQTLADYWLKLPDERLHLVTAIGLRDGSKSNGVAFEVQANGRQLYRKSIKPDTGWIPVEVDLSPWAGKPVMLTLITDSLGDNSFDWAVWAEPRLVR